MAAADDEGRSEGFEDVPEEMQELIATMGIVEPPEDAPDPVKMLIGRCEAGRCAACYQRLGENTVAMVDAVGIHLLFCSGVCMTDFMVCHWLEEKYEEISQSIAFRGGSGDIADPSDEPNEDDPRTE